MLATTPEYENQIAQVLSSDARTSDVERTGAEMANGDGTLHQSQLGPKAKRKHFFASLDLSFADAVHRDAADVVFSEEEEVRLLRSHQPQFNIDVSHQFQRAVKRKIDRRILPLVICRCVFCLHLFLLWMRGII